MDERVRRVAAESAFAKAAQGTMTSSSEYSVSNDQMRTFSFARDGEAISYHGGNEWSYPATYRRMTPLVAALASEWNAQAAEIAQLNERVKRLQLDAARYQYVRTLNAREFAELFAANIAGNGTFDDLVDNAKTMRTESAKNSPISEF